MSSTPSERRPPTSLKSVLFDRLTPVRTNAPYALIDYPDYLNPGDAAIWLGTRAVLDKLNGTPPAYTSTLKNFSAQGCRSAIGDGVIYFLGGGNFGDLYPRHHRARLRVLSLVPRNPVVQLSASCAWMAETDAAVLEETRRVLGNREPAIFFAREEKSRADLERLLGLESTLCPDLAHALHFVPSAPTADLCAVLRNDREASQPVVPSAIEIFDWRDLKAQVAWNRVGKLALALAPRSKKLATQDWVTSAKVASAVSLLRPARTVITDRLHAFILSAQLGRNVLVLNNQTGKVFAYIEAWQQHFPNVRKAANLWSAVSAVPDFQGRIQLDDEP
ncbi:polysaccharide pyruvyl transferase family protein [Mesorhizobium sp.]|uniref:polysaccharide pyruvyl transferase family protein n=1 Tax=Mesorhizobium sp. TaxID=1871066 RepID=UPI000FEA581E|nr:polysaccharide pyruvyl transferase family protein [Mesorhizobium sp.]RWP35188.1 MAG: hypothetical protein EOR03_13675 [Mesorhizobium sp.]